MTRRGGEGGRLRRWRRWRRGILDVQAAGEAAGGERGSGEEAALGLAVRHRPGLGPWRALRAVFSPNSPESNPIPASASCKGAARGEHSVSRVPLNATVALTLNISAPPASCRSSVYQFEPRKLDLDMGRGRHLPL